MGWRRKRTVHLFHLASVNQGAYIHFAVERTGVVGDAGEIFGALTVQGSQEIARHADTTKAGGHKHSAIRNVRHCFIKCLVDFLLHRRRLLPSRPAHQTYYGYMAQPSTTPQTGPSVPPL